MSIKVRDYKVFSYRLLKELGIGDIHKVLNVDYRKKEVTYIDFSGFTMNSDSFDDVEFLEDTLLVDKGYRNIYTGYKLYIDTIYNNIHHKGIYIVEHIEHHGSYILTTGKGYDTKNSLPLNCDTTINSRIVGNIYTPIL